MNSHHAGPHTEASAEDLVGQAIQRAGPPPAVPLAIQTQLRQATHAAWQRKVGDRTTARRRAQRFRAFALAALLLLGIGLAYLLLPGQPWTAGFLRAPVATVEYSSDPNFVHGTAMKAGSMVETHTATQLALRLGSGTSLRLDANTRLELHTAQRLTLHRGGVYLDSAPGQGAVEVTTPFGITRDLGTQFEVRLDTDGLLLAVREGEVELEQPQGSHKALAGTALLVDAEGHVERRSIPSHGASWAWVLATAPPFELEGSSLWAFLQWVTRETGWRLETSTPGLEERLRNIKAHGSLEGLRPDEAVEVVLPGAGLGFEVQDGTLIVAGQ